MVLNYLTKKRILLKTNKSIHNGSFKKDIIYNCSASGFSIVEPDSVKDFIDESQSNIFKAMEKNNDSDASFEEIIRI